jgi:hypothetical protein
MDPIATYIVARIRHNNALEEAEQAQTESSQTELVQTASFNRVKRSLAFIWQQTRNVVRSIDRMNHEQPPVFNGKERNGFDLSES